MEEKHAWNESVTITATTVLSSWQISIFGQSRDVYINLRMSHSCKMSVRIKCGGACEHQIGIDHVNCRPEIYNWYDFNWNEKSKPGYWQDIMLP